MSTLERLEQAYRDLDWLQPLGPTDPLLYRPLFGDFLNSIARELVLLKGESRTMLMHGHVGSGKSTFFNCLEVEPELTAHFLAVPISIKEVSDPEDIEAIDLFLAFATAALKSASGQVRLRPVDVPHLVKLYKELKGLITVETTRETKREGRGAGSGGAAIPAMLNWLTAGFQLNYAVSLDTRKKVRETYAPEVGTLIERVNSTIAAIESRLGKDRRLLFLVDDTDKLSIERGLRLFDQQGHQLAQLRAAAAFMVDKAVACSGRFSGITTRLGASRPFPGAKIVEADGESSEVTLRNCGLIRELLHRRLPEDLITPGARDKLIGLGGGHCRETLRIAREATFRALARTSPRVDEADVDYAAIGRFNEFNLTQEELQLLQHVLDNPWWCPPTADVDVEVPKAPFLRLLNAVALLEYSNGEQKWLRPHPVLIPRLRRLKA